MSLVPPVGKGTSRALVTLAFAVVVLIGSLNFVAVRVSNRELPPFWGAGLRFMLAAFLFAAAALILRLRPPRGRALAWLAVYGLLSFAISYALMYWALVRVSAGMAAVVLAAVPLVTVLLAAAQKLEPLSRKALVGSLVALAGILWKTTEAGGIGVPVGALLAMILATASIAQSVIVGKRVSGHHPVLINAVGMACAFPLLLALSLLVGEQRALPKAQEVVLAISYLVIVGSVGMFVLFLWIIRKWTASATSYTFVLFPVVTMLLEAWLDDVPLTARVVSGAVLVIAGVWFGVFSGHDEPRPAP